MTEPGDISDLVYADRYAWPGESLRIDTYRRVAIALAAREAGPERERHAALFLENFLAGAIGAGRIMANAGAADGDGDGGATMVNCFVQPAIDPGLGWPQGLDAALARAVRTMSMGGGVGYDFSPVPPADSGAGRGGACAVIDRYDQACQALATPARRRRGAQMGVLACDHPDLPAFLRAKAGRRRWPTLNLSVALSDRFLRAVENDEAWTLRHACPPAGGQASQRGVRGDDGTWPYARLPARRLWEALTAAACRDAEPGVLFVDTINALNPLRDSERLSATNPCGEQPLPPHGSCVLGPINVSRFVRNPFGANGPPGFDFSELGRRVRIQVRLLDNVLDLTRWPLPEQAAEAQAKRRIGVGLSGLGDALLMLRLDYGSPAARVFAARIARCIRDQAYLASAGLAAERGVFPAYASRPYLEPRAGWPPLPPAVQVAIRRHGLRNSHLVSFAPTGSVSIAFFDNCSTGIEPAHAWQYRRRLRIGEAPPRNVVAQNPAWRLWRRLHGDGDELPPYFRRAADIAPSAHIAMLAALQPWVDAAISKTVPLPPECTAAEVGALFLQAWRLGVKGLTVFRPDPRMPAVLEPARHEGQTGPAAPAAA